MRLATVRYAQQPRLVLVDGNELWLPAPHSGWPESMLDLIAAGPERWRVLATELSKIKRDAVRLPRDGTEWLAPIPRPNKNVMCLGWNYAEHVAESASASGRKHEPPKDPIVFTKNVTSVSGPYADVPAQASVTQQLDWEVELGVVIGVGGRGIARERALEHVFGYTVINDVSARDLQFRHKQYFLGKSLDGSCPMGPVIVTREEVLDPQALDLKCWVNGELKQLSNTHHMIFDVATIIHVLSRGMALEPGDIIATGTPSGVGFARTPPEFLKAGDLVECEIQGIGRLRNRVV
ncbi:MAG: fumarylacetoacetate hydrolase family protein [Pseudomonadota bacterium]|nr:MAG: fumarylacetoacetate hydrolase family protein [Pseudomonadota bacterium]